MGAKMAVVLVGWGDADVPHDVWGSISGDVSSLDPKRRISDLPRRLDAEFDRVAAEWWALGCSLQETPSARLAHAPSCAPNVSDLGVMLAWTRLVDEWAGAGETVMVVCDDPWMFRHLATRRGVAARAAPSIAGRTMALAIRGFAARSWAAIRFAFAALTMRPRRSAARGASVLLCYVHPGSTSAGHDAYFGTLPREDDRLRRLLHVDGPLRRTRELMRDHRTASLHAWGNIWVALALPFRRWRPTHADRSGPYAWLVRRAAALEGATAQAAAIAWQLHCQRRWLDATSPTVLAWPWENHGWERSLVREARRRGIHTIGYQHTIVGRQELNYGLAANATGLAEIPDVLACSGEAGRLALDRFGYPGERITVAGAWRYTAPSVMSYHPEGAVLFALCTDRTTAAQMVAAADDLGRRGWPILLKEHPMAPSQLAVPSSVRCVGASQDEMRRLAAVVYAASTIGLDALIAGIPTFRFLPDGWAALDPLPEGTPQVAVSADNIAEALRVSRPQTVERRRFFAAPEIGYWRALLRLPQEARV